jgi:hypothetical protein
MSSFWHQNFRPGGFFFNLYRFLGFGYFYFLMLLQIIMVLKSTYIYLKEYTISYIMQDHCPSRKMKTWPAVDLQNAPENLGAHILNNFNSVKNIIKRRLFQNFLPMKLKKTTNRVMERENFILEIGTIYISSFLTIFFSLLCPFFVIDTWEMSSCFVKDVW